MRAGSVAMEYGMVWYGSAGSVASDYHVGPPEDGGKGKVKKAKGRRGGYY